MAGRPQKVSARSLAGVVGAAGLLVAFGYMLGGAGGGLSEKRSAWTVRVYSGGQVAETWKSATKPEFREDGLLWFQREDGVSVAVQGAITVEKVFEPKP